jgi:hypothetical protein
MYVPNEPYDNLWWMLVPTLFGQFTPNPWYAVWISKPPVAVGDPPQNPDRLHTVGACVPGWRCTVMSGVVTTCRTSPPRTFPLASTYPKWTAILSPFLANSAGKIESSSFRIMIDVATTCQYGTRIMTIVLFHWNQEVSIFGRKWLYCNLQKYKHVQPKVTFKHQHIEHEETTALSPTLIQPMNVQTKCSIKDHLHTPANRSWTNDDTFTTSSSIVPQTSPINQRPIWHKPSATARFYEIIFMEYPGLRYAD